jgi:hypothetical protein
LVVFTHRSPQHLRAVPHEASQRPPPLLPLLEPELPLLEPELLPLALPPLEPPLLALVPLDPPLLEPAPLEPLLPELLVPVPPLLELADPELLDEPPLPEPLPPELLPLEPLAPELVIPPSADASSNSTKVAPPQSQTTPATKKSDPSKPIFRNMTEASRGSQAILGPRPSVIFVARPAASVTESDRPPVTSRRNRLVRGERMFPSRSWTPCGRIAGGRLPRALPA